MAKAQVPLSFSLCPVSVSQFSYFRRPNPPVVLDVSTLALLTQVFIVYVVSVVHKYQDAYQIWFVEGATIRVPVAAKL